MSLFYTAFTLPFLVFVFQGAVGTNITIDVICRIMTDKSQGSEVERYARVNQLILATYSQKCQDFKYANIISELTQTDWNSSASEGGIIFGYS